MKITPVMFCTNNNKLSTKGQGVKMGNPYEHLGNDVF
ncbi:hypothetical protein tpqmel_0941, partial [Candidatus Gastranaerophilus sp. (ex Termes propinquus)]